MQGKEVVITWEVNDFTNAILKCQILVPNCWHVQHLWGNLHLKQEISLAQVFDIAEGFAYSLSSFSHVHFEKVRQNYHNQCFKKKQDV